MRVSKDMDRLRANILGVVRNGGVELGKTLERINALRGRLLSSKVIIATNDNSDDTHQQLIDFAREDHSVYVLNLDGLIITHPDRVDRIAAARNAVLSRLFSLDEIEPFCVVLDLDGPCSNLDERSVTKALCRDDVEWEGLFANPQTAFYDLYALRCPNWCECDVWKEVDAARKPLFFRRRWRRELIRQKVFGRQYHIPTSFPAIPVDSAFGGLAIYRTGALNGLTYSSRLENGEQVCEHVSLHNRMRARGARLFIDPGLTTIAPIEHLGETSGSPFPMDLLAELTFRQNNH